MLNIGISACFFHADPQRPIFKGKTLLYVEESLLHWVQQGGAIPWMLPSVAAAASSTRSANDSSYLETLVQRMDGLILHGGADVCPKSYGETPLKPEWNGDWVRDQYEISLFHEFLRQKKPILGICRGAQLINVAQKGTLYQDIESQVPRALVHRNWNIYDQNIHSIQMEEGSLLQKIYPGQENLQVNSIHHQAIKDLGKNLIPEAYAEDGTIEAIRLNTAPFVYAVQWHPEFHSHPLLPQLPLLHYFLQEAQNAKHH